MRFKFNKDLAKFEPRQIAAVEQLKSGKTKFLLYGGALGGGKSYFLRWYCVRRLLEFAKMGLRNVPVMLACEDYPSLKDRQLQKIGTEFPEWLGKSHGDHKLYRNCFILDPEYGGGIICFRNLDDPSKYQSSEFAMICIDELTKNKYDIFTFLRTRLRWPGLPDIECYFIGATNPGGVGHGWVKQFWIDKVFPPEWMDPVDYRGSFAFIPSKADDNPYLDASYFSMLQTLPENLRKAFRDGDWNVFVGQAFPEWTESIGHIDSHVIEPIPVPDYAPLYFTFDWGFGKPYSVLYWWVDGDGRIYLFSEIYGCQLGTPDVGLRETDMQIADKIKLHEEDLGINNRTITRICDPTCFNKKPNYLGGGQGISTAEVFDGMGIKMIPGDASRTLKVRQFHERLRKRIGEPPMMQVYKTAIGFIRTIPLLQQDENNIEDVCTVSEDHPYDSAALVCMERPLGITDDELQKKIEAEELRAKRAEMKERCSASHAASEEYGAIVAELKEKYEEQVNDIWVD